MRIYNRDQSAILGARNNRLAKMRAFSSSTKTRASSKGTTQSAPKSKNYRTSAWMQFLNQFQNGTAVSGDKIVENQKREKNPFTRRERTPENSLRRKWKVLYPITI